MIRLISAPAFIATKLEAFYDRGKGDVYISHDLEDTTLDVEFGAAHIAKVAGVNDANEALEWLET